MNFQTVIPVIATATTTSQAVLFFRNFQNKFDNSMGRPQPVRSRAVRALVIACMVLLRSAKVRIISGDMA